MPALRLLQSGRTTFTFTPDPDQNFDRAFTDYFVTGRQDDMAPSTRWLEIETMDAATMLHNGDGLCYYDLHKAPCARTGVRR